MVQHRQNIFKLASILLNYPEEELLKNEQLEEIIKEIPDRSIRTSFQKFLKEISKLTYEELCTLYVNTFDFNEKTTLYLTYRIFKENRERGPALIKLKFEFAKADCIIGDEELPDYLPLILEFASFAPVESVRRIFSIHRKSIDDLYYELKQIKSPYRFILAACTKAIQNVITEEKVS